MAGLKGPFLYDYEAERLSALRDGFRIGRKQGDLHFADDPGVGDPHCRFHIERGGIAYVEDLGSPHGTTLERERSEARLPAARKISLAEGDVLKLGARRLHFSWKQEIPTAELGTLAVDLPPPRKRD